MGTTYTRQSSADITDGSVIEATHFNNEFDQLQSAFASSTGHSHDGTTGEGGYVPLIADSDALNKILVDTSSNRFGVFVEVASTAVEQFRFQDGAIVPVTDNDIDLGTAALEFKDAYFDGTVTTDGLALPTTTITDILDEDNMASDSATALATQQSIKAYVDAQVTAQDLDFQADTGGALSIDLDSESLTFTGGTGIDTSGSGNAVTFAIDSTVATLTGTQTLTNKSIDADTNTLSNLEVDNLKTGVLDTDLTTVSLSDDTLASAKAIKTYVDSQVTAQDLDFQGDAGGALSIDLDSETLTIAGGTGIDTSGSLNTLTVNIDSTVATLTGTQTLTNKTLTSPTISNILNTGTLTLPTSTDTLVGRDTTDTLTNKTLTSPVLNTSVSGTAVLDDDTFATASATTLATSESIKAYVDSSVATANELSELTDTNITTPADGALLFYDTLTAKWIDNVVSGDITIADTGVASISSGVIVNADINASAGIDATKIAGGTVDNTEFGYLNGVTSAVQTQIDGKQPLDAQLTDIAGLTPTDGNFIVGNGTNFISESGATARTSLGLGSIATQDSTSVSITGGSIDGTTIGGTTAGAGSFTNITGSGTITLNSLVYPSVDGTSGQVIQTDGVGNLTFATPASGATQGFAIAMAVAL